MMTLPAILALLYILYGLFRPINTLIYAAFGLLCAGSLAVIPPAMVGDVTLLPGPFAFILIIAKTMFSRNGSTDMLRSAFSFKQMGYLTAFTIVGVIGAFVLPKVLMGQVQTFPLRGNGGIATLEPLRPTNGNITQTAYVVISYLTAVSFSVLAKDRNFIKYFSNAILVLGITVVISGVVEYTLGLAGQGALLESFRTSSYITMSEGAVSGVRRIIGLMPEASSYGALAVTALSLLLFCRNLYEPRFRNRVVFPLIFACFLLVALCTSSAAYVALAAIIGLFFWDISSRIGVGTVEQKRQALVELVGVGVITLLGFTLLMVFEDTRNLMIQLLDNAVFKKTQSDSFIERNNWNSFSVKAFFDSKGAGVGLGSARTSNFFVNILASTGVIGSFFFAAFLIKIAFIKCKIDNIQIIEAVNGAKLTIVPIFVVSGLVGTTPDYGAITAALFGVVIGGANIRLVKIKPETVTADGLPIVEGPPRPVGYEPENVDKSLIRPDIKL
jgi:hypothetical protein